MTKSLRFNCEFVIYLLFFCIFIGCIGCTKEKPNAEMKLTPIYSSNLTRAERRAVVTALSERSNKYAVRQLIQALTDEYDEIRAIAARALGKIGDKDAVEPLLQSLHDKKDFVAATAAFSLGEIKDERAIEPLITALRQGSLYVGDSDVPSGVLPAFGEKALAPLLAVLNEESDIKVLANTARALAKLGDKRAIEPLRKIMKKAEDPTLVKYIEHCISELNKQPEND